MFQVRGGVFETNSSSTHSLSIDTSAIPTQRNTVIKFHIDDFRLCEGRVKSTDYLYTAILQREDHDVDLITNKIMNTLIEHNIFCYFEDTDWEWDAWNEWEIRGNIDNNYEAQKLVDAIVDDEDLLIKYLSRTMLRIPFDADDLIKQIREQI